MWWSEWAISSGKPEGDKSTNAGMIDFSTASKKLAWKNGLIVIVEVQNDPKTQEYSIAAHERKQTLDFPFFRKSGCLFCILAKPNARIFEFGNRY